MQNKKIIGIACLVALVIWAGVFYTSKNSSAPIVDLNQAKSDAGLKKINILLPKSKVNVAYYASYNAVVNNSPGKLSAGFDNLISKGVKIALCTYTAEIRGLNQPDLFDGVDFHSQYDLSKLVNECDRFLSFV